MTNNEPDIKVRSFTSHCIEFHDEVEGDGNAITEVVVKLRNFLTFTAYDRVTVYANGRVEFFRCDQEPDDDPDTAETDA